MRSIVMRQIENRSTAEQAIRQHRFGVIETGGGQLFAIHFRRLPHVISWPEIWPVGSDYHAAGPADHCWLYYNQPWGNPDFLALKYVVSTRPTSYATFRATLDALDGVARTKGSDALLCDARNVRISDRLLQRFGWQPHCLQRGHRHHVKRFYGSYPDVSMPWVEDPSATASMRVVELAL